MTATPQAVEQPVGRQPVTVQVLRAARPKQWIKNLLVFAAPFAAGVVLRPEVMLRCLLAGVAMVTVSSACYLVNDVLDRELDRQHASKRRRPVASGALPVRVALQAAGVLLALGLVLALSVGTAALGVVALYATLTMLYGAWLKHVPWLELVVVASGFVLRTLLGAMAARVDASEWFLLVVSAAALVVVASKRSSELLAASAVSRPVLRSYLAPRLHRLRLGSAAVLVSAYAGWAYYRPDTTTTLLAAASLVPVMFVTARWSWRTDHGDTGAPEEVIVADPWIRAGVLAWAVVFAASVLAR